MRYKSIFVLLFLVALVINASGKLTSNALTKEGTSLANQGMFNESLSAYEKAIQLNPGNVAAWNGKGLALYNLGKYNDSLIAYEKAIYLNPGNVGAWNGKGLALFYQGKYDESISAFNQAIKLDPYNSDYQEAKELALGYLNKSNRLLMSMPAANVSIGPIVRLGSNSQDEAQTTTITVTFGSGWHGEENWSGISTQWMESNSTLIAYSPKSYTANLNLKAFSFYRPRTLEIYVGNALAARTAISPSGFTNIATPVQLIGGNNTISLQVSEGCERPNDIKELNNSDKRCLSIAVRDIEVS